MSLSILQTPSPGNSLANCLQVSDEGPKLFCNDFIRGENKTLYVLSGVTEEDIFNEDKKVQDHVLQTMSGNVWQGCYNAYYRLSCAMAFKTCISEDPPEESEVCYNACEEAATCAPHDRYKCVAWKQIVVRDGLPRYEDICTQRQLIHYPPAPVDRGLCSNPIFGNDRDTCVGWVPQPPPPHHHHTSSASSIKNIGVLALTVTALAFHVLSQFD